MVVFDSNEILRQSVVIREKTENISKLTGEIAILCQNISRHARENTLGTWRRSINLCGYAR